MAHDDGGDVQGHADLENFRTTEWEDILVQKKIIAPREHFTTDDEHQKQFVELLESQVSARPFFCVCMHRHTPPICCFVCCYVLILPHR
jgi:hypothetical protein